MPRATPPKGSLLGERKSPARNRARRSCPALTVVVRAGTVAVRRSVRGGPATEAGPRRSPAVWQPVASRVVEVTRAPRSLEREAPAQSYATTRQGSVQVGAFF